jgi:DNA mismatch repair protein MutS2
MRPYIPLFYIKSYYNIDLIAAKWNADAEKMDGLLPKITTDRELTISKMPIALYCY